jgi:MFS family permease
VRDSSRLAGDRAPSLLLRRPSFRRVWLSQVVSLLGDWMSYIAVSLLSLREGGGVVALAIVMVGHTLPNALFAPVAGVLADRLDRRRLLLLANIAQGVLTLAMAAAAALGSVGIVQVLVFVRASVAALLFPVQSAVLRHVVAEDELLEANAITSATWSVMFAVGMAAGGAIAVLGPTTALLADACTFGVAALLLLGLPPMIAEGRPGEGGVRAALASVHLDMSLAWKHAWERPALLDAVLAWGRPALLDAVLAKTPVALASGGAMVLLNLVASEVAFAGTAALTLGLLQCVRGVGTGVGPLLCAALIRRGLPQERASRIASWTVFGAIAVFAGTRHWAALLLITLAWGMGGGSNWVLSSAALQRLSPTRFVGRLSAIDALAFTIGLCLTALGGAMLVDRIGMDESAAWLGLGAGVIGWMGVRWMVRRLAQSTEQVETP